MSEWSFCTRPSSSSAASVWAHKTTDHEAHDDAHQDTHHDAQGVTCCEKDHGRILSIIPRMHTIAGSNRYGSEMKIGSQVLAIWKALALRRAEERQTQRQQARDVGMEYFKATGILNRSISQTLGDPRQWAAFVVQVVFTWWKLCTSTPRRARLHGHRLLCQHSKQSDTRARQSFLHQPLGIPRAVTAMKPGVVRAKNAQHGDGCAGAESARPHQKTPHSRKYCQPVRGKNIPEPSTPPIRPHGKGKGLRARLSSAENHENSGQGERANPCSDRHFREHHERHCSPPTHFAENRNLTLNMAKQSPSNHAAEEQRSGEAATPQNPRPRSPFVVGGPLGAVYPSYWTTMGISAFNTVSPRPLVAWTIATTATEKQQQVSASGPVSSEGGYKRRGLGTPPSRSTSANRSKHRRYVPPTGIVAGKGCLASCDIVHRQRDRLKMPAFYDVSQDPPGSLRASSTPGRCITYNTAVDRGVDGRPLLPRQGLVRTSEEIRQGPQEEEACMCFGRYMVLVDDASIR